MISCTQIAFLDTIIYFLIKKGLTLKYLIEIFPMKSSESENFNLVVSYEKKTAEYWRNFSNAEK